MATDKLFIIRMSEDPIMAPAPTFADGEGAEVQFLGTVRGEEDGRPITGIEYSAYAPMADKMFTELAERGQQAYGPHRVEIQHRLGFVAACEPSIWIRVKTKHSAEGFEICRWYLKEIKKHVPIWKKPIFHVG